MIEGMASREWQCRLSALRARLTSVPDREGIVGGWAQLADVLGAPQRDEFGRLPVLYDLLDSCTPSELRRRASLGRLLAELKTLNPAVMKRLLPRLLSHEHDNRSMAWSTMHGALLELSVYEHLRGQRLEVTFPPERKKQKNPDLVVATPTPVAIEVSYLASPSTIEHARRLREVLHHRVVQAVGQRGYVITIECNGWARELLPRVERACEELRDTVNRVRAPWTKELAPGLTFTVRRDELETFVVVQGARVYEKDPFGAESVLTRLPSKLREESSQLRGFDGVGLVFIGTSEIQILLHQVANRLDSRVQKAIYRELVGAVLDAGREHPHVDAFVLYDVLGSDVVPRPNLPRNARVHQHIVPPRELQRVAFIPNPARVGRLPRHVEGWFSPPLPW